MSYLQGVAALTLMNMVRVELLLRPIERSQLKWFDQDASQALSIGGLLGESKWKEAPGWSQNTLERL